MKIEDCKELYEERLAIMIIDGGLKEEVAKARASKETQDLFITHNNADQAKTYNDLIILKNMLKSL